MKDYYNTLTKDVTLRYTFGRDENNNKVGDGGSDFFYIDNLTTVKDEA